MHHYESNGKTEPTVKEKSTEVQWVYEDIESGTIQIDTVVHRLHAIYFDSYIVAYDSN